MQEDPTDPLYATEECQTLLSIYASYYPKIGYHLPWIGYVIIKDEVVAGSCGFTGQPINNEVEIAYWTFKSFEGQGIASFACTELISIALRTNPELTIIAKTAPEENASVNILKKNNFTFSRVVQDDEIGDAWLWTRNKIPNSHPSD